MTDFEESLRLAHKFFWETSRKNTKGRSFDRDLCDSMDAGYSGAYATAAMRIKRLIREYRKEHAEATE